MRVLAKIITASLGSLLFVLCLTSPALALNTMLDYTSFPPIVSEPTKPNVLVLISNDHTGFYPGYNDLYNYDNTVDYWGYFDPNKYYEDKNGVFTPKGWMVDHYSPSNKYWSGNFLNWVTMTHADFLRKALTGGKRQNDATSSTTVVRGDVPANHAWKKRYTGSDLGKLVPSAYANTGNYFANVGETMEPQNSKGGSLSKKPIPVVVATCDPSMPEVNCTPYQTGNMKPEGLLQRYATKMLFGLMSYSHERPDRGGVIRTPIRDITNEFSQVNGSDNSSSDSMLTYIARYTEKGWDPLAEMLYDAIRYYRGNEGAQSGYCPTKSKDDNYFFFGCDSKNRWVDPVQAWCQKNNIIIINDEYPSRDGEEVPHSAFSNYTDTPAVGTNTPYNPDLTAITKLIGDNEGITGRRWDVGEIIGDMNGSCTSKRITNLGQSRGICPGEPGAGGTFYLGALAFDAFTNDMRDDLDNVQNIRTYTIAFRASPGGYQIPKPPLNQMWLAGKYGNFDDKDGNGLPNLESEWMKSSETCDKTDPDDYDCLPKGFFYAEGGSAIEDAIVEVFESILRRAASGTALSVLATSGQGEGNLVQAYYRPAIAEGTRDIMWTGYMQSIWIDKYGNLREDTDQNAKLEVDKDRIIEYFVHADGSPRVRLFDVSNADPYPDTTTGSFTVVEMNGMAAVWEAGQILADTPSSARKIKTYIDIDNDGVVDSGEFIDLNDANEAKIQPYLAVQNDLDNIHLGKTETIRANNLIAFIRGDDPNYDTTPFIDPANMAVRDRILGGQVWKLGDVIESTPVAISAPPDRFDLIYKDLTYYEYYKKYKNRETMIYVGSNDGMIHAFTSWQYDQTAQKFVEPAAAASGEVIGSEVWSYVPQNLLPHLKWLSRPDYTHVHYMDLQPRIMDARIFSEDATHIKGWGTIMILGMNTGGGRIQVTGDFDYDGSNDDYREFKPSFMVFDITDPRKPVLLWERTYDALGFTRTIPSVIRLGDSTSDPGTWYMLFGNGPDAGDISGTPNYRGETNSKGHIYIVDLKTGKPKSSTGNDWWAEVPDQQAFFTTPISLDRDLNYNVDASYLATTYDADLGNASAAPHNWKGSVYRLLTKEKGTVTDPSTWTLQKLYDSPRPITAPGAISTDKYKNIWVYFGTGRYISKGVNSDETSIEQEYLFGIKDPYYNRTDLEAPTYYEKDGVSKTLDLLDASPFVILTSNDVACDTGTGYEYPGRSWTDTTSNGHPCDTTNSSNVHGWTFDGLLSYARHKDGWIRELDIGLTAERSLNKPTLFGGLALYTTFSPKGDVCDYGGYSTLWALYYETGTAYKVSLFSGGFGEQDVTVGGTSDKKVADNFNIGSGKASSVGVHVGAQNEKPAVQRYSMAADGSFVKDPNGEYVASANVGQTLYRQNPDGSYTADPNGTFVKNYDGTFCKKGFMKKTVSELAALQSSDGSILAQLGDATVFKKEGTAALEVRGGLRSWLER